MSKPRGTESLTQREERFCQLYAVDGMTATDAYLTAYNCKSRKSASDRAVLLKKKRDVKKRITDLQERLAFHLSWSKAQSEQHLTQIVKESMHDGSPKAMSNAIKAITELNKMCGYHAPTQTQSLNIEVGAGDIDAIMLNLGFQRTEALPKGKP